MTSAMCMRYELSPYAQVLASPTYPVNEWLDLGTFTAKYAQGEQTFEVPEPAFARCDECPWGCSQ